MMPPSSMVADRPGLAVRLPTARVCPSNRAGTIPAGCHRVSIRSRVELLVTGRPVKDVAYQVGYRQPSAFVEMFRRTMGTAPKAWVAALDEMQRRRSRDDGIERSRFRGSREERRFVSTKRAGGSR
jgi:Helix-turn-helix domain